MHINHCSKCGKEFETKNPKRIVCPNCLYLDRAAAPSVAPIIRRPESAPPPGHGGGGYGSPPGGQGEGYGPPPRQGGYGPPQQRTAGPPYGQPGGYGPRPQRPGGFQGGGPRRPPPGRGGPMGRGGPPGRGGPGMGRGRPAAPPRKLLVPREMLVEIEKLYKAMLPLPNPDAHVKIGEALNLEANKVFFGINLVRQKMKLPKLDYPKRPLAVSQDQLTAVQALYEPFLPVPPIGIHKILAKQLRMDEWRVHVAIGLVRKQMSMPRWNEDREDLPPQMKAQILAAQAAKEKEKAEGKSVSKKAAAKAGKKETSEPDAVAEEVAVEEG